MSNSKNANKPGYKHTPLGWIPDDWEVKELGEVLTLKRGYDLTHAQRRSGSIPVITSGGFNGYHDTPMAKAPGVVTGRYGTIGEVFYSEIDYWPHNTTLFVHEFKKSEPRYIYHLLSSVNFNKYSDKSAVQGINRNHVHNEVVAIPSNPKEQRRIATILSTWDEAITKTRQLIAQLQERNKGLMQVLLTGKKRLKGFVKNWNEVELGSLGESYNGLVGKSKEDFGTGQKFITYLTVFNNPVIRSEDGFGFVNVDDSESQSHVKYGDILFTVSSETPHEVGMSSVLLTSPESLYLNSFCFGFRLFDFKTLHPLFAAFLFRSEHVRKEIVKLAQGSTRFNLSKSGIKKLQLKIPEIDEQCMIAEYCKTLTHEVDLCKKKLTVLRQQRKGLMQKMLTGEVRVNTNNLTT